VYTRAAGPDLSCKSAVWSSGAAPAEHDISA
jgi:hypothetical protein